MPVPKDERVQQRKEALQSANDVRKYRGQIKKDLKAGKLSIIDLVLEPPEKIQKMSLSTLLLATPRFGWSKVDYMMKYCRISPAKLVGDLTERQKAELVAMLRR
jgi:hypothetical protein